MYAAHRRSPMIRRASSSTAAAASPPTDLTGCLASDAATPTCSPVVTMHGRLPSLGGPADVRWRGRAHSCHGCKVRDGRTLDLNAVVGLWEDCGLVPAFVGFRNELQRQVARDPRLFLVAHDEGEVVGAIVGGWDGRLAWVSRFSVRPDRRREGIARVIADAFLTRLEELGRPARLVVLDDLAEGTAFWQARGLAEGPAARSWLLDSGDS